MDWDIPVSQRVEEIEKLGKKVWLIFNTRHIDDANAVTLRLSKLGYKMMYKNDNNFGSIYLFDMNKSAR